MSQSRLIFKHTPGPWMTHAFGEAVYNTPTSKRICVTATQGTSANAEDNANAILIASSPRLLQTLLDQYIWLQTEAQKDLNNGSATMAVKSDAQRAALRNAISAASGIQCEEIQNYVEGVAHEKARS